MNKAKLFSFALAALMLGACSSDEIVESGGKPQWNSEGKGYINLAIQLPTQPSTRASNSNNDQFDDGTPDEYAVKDATLILFVDGQVNSAYDMKLNFSPVGSSNDNITTTAKITQKINSVSGSKIEALVVLNRNGMFTVNSDNTLSVGTELMTGKSLDDLNSEVNTAIKNNDWHSNGFLMSNAVLTTKPGGTEVPTGNVVTLTEINAGNIKSTEEEANANPAANIYVERAVAKVTLSAQKGSLTSSPAESPVEYTIDGWILDNTNKSSKLVRTATNFGTWKGYASNSSSVLSPYRFVGNTAVGKDITNTDTYYRVYWGEDYNYAEVGQPGEYFNTIGGKTPDDTELIKADGVEAGYCFENTMDLANMQEANSTRVIVKAIFNGGNDFYIVDGDKSKFWTDEEVLKKEIAARVLTNPIVYKWAKDNAAAGQTITSEDFNVTFKDPAAGKIEVEDIEFTADAKLKEPHETFPETDAVNAAKSSIEIDYYVGGASYYSVWIKHFGDDLTPWKDGETNTPTASNIYPGGEQNYLGRYGVLRNNWYDITVNSIKYLGSPTVEEVTGETIDKIDSYISVNINVLSWAKRTQEVEL